MGTLTCIRHGKAPQAEGQTDLERVLGEVGRQQAFARRTAMGNPKFNTVMASIAGRAVDTGAIVAGIERHRVIALTELYFDPTSPMGAEMDEFFKRKDLGYAPVRRYLNAGAQVVLDHGKIALEAVRRSLLEWGDEDVCVAGHAVCLPAMGMVACGEDTDGWHLLAAANLGECEGFVIDFDARKVTLIQ